jgi:hypothetical protein
MVRARKKIAKARVVYHRLTGTNGKPCFATIASATGITGGAVSKS